MPPAPLFAELILIMPAYRTVWPTLRPSIIDLAEGFPWRINCLMSCVVTEVVGNGVVGMRWDETKVRSCAVEASLQVQTETTWRKFGVSVEKLRRACGMNALVLFYRISPDSDVFLADHSFISSPSHIFIQSAL